jgi:hypothetical protein
VYAGVPIFQLGLVLIFFQSDVVPPNSIEVSAEQDSKVLNSILVTDAGMIIS